MSKKPAKPTITVRMRIHQGPNPNSVLWCEFVRANGRVVKAKGMEKIQGLIAVPLEAVIETGAREGSAKP